MQNYFQKIMMIACVLFAAGLVGQLSAQERIVNVALSNTFGFGGHNASVVLRGYR